MGKNKANFFLCSKDAKNKSTIKLVEKASEAGHTIGYRTLKSNDKRFHELAPEDLKAELKEAKKKFKELLDMDLEYVLLPSSKHDCTEQMEAIYKLGMYPVVPGHEAKDSKANKAMSKKHAGYIVHQEAKEHSAAKDLLKLAKKESLKLVPLAKCLDENAKPEKAAKKGNNKKYVGSRGLIRASDVEGMKNQQPKDKDDKKKNNNKKGGKDADSADPDVDAEEKAKKEEAEKLKKEAEALAAKKNSKGNGAASMAGSSAALTMAAGLLAAFLI